MLYHLQIVYKFFVMNYYHILIYIKPYLYDNLHCVSNLKINLQNRIYYLSRHQITNQILIIRVCIAECDRQHVFPTGQAALKRVCNASVGWQSTDQIPDCKGKNKQRHNCIFRDQ